MKRDYKFCSTKPFYKHQQEQRQMNIDKEVFALWKEISPGSAFGAGLKEYAGTMWIPSHYNKKQALMQIKKLEKTKDPVARKF